MDLFKALTGKNPAEFEHAAHVLVDTPDIELFKKLVKQDDFLFDFVKNNVAKRIQNACNEDNYKNLLSFFEYYSPSYAPVIAEVLHQHGGTTIFEEIKNLFLNGSNAQKSYAAKYFSFCENQMLNELLPKIREYACLEDENLATNCIELLSKLNDTQSKERAIEQLGSEDEFEQYSAVKFLVTYGAKDALPKIIEVMKKSSLSENIASEIPYLVSIEDLLKENFDTGILVLCHIISAIPEILPPSAIVDYNIYELLEGLYYDNLTSSSALLIRMAKDKVNELSENDEYLFDCDKSTKDEIGALNKFLSGVNINKLKSLLYDELFEESEFVFFAADYVDEIEALEALLDSNNQTLLLKVLTILKEKQALKQEHKELVSDRISNQGIKAIVDVL